MLPSCLPFRPFTRVTRKDTVEDRHRTWEGRSVRAHGAPERRAVAPDAGRRTAGPATAVQRMLGLQRLAGNAAVARALTDERHPHTAGCGDHPAAVQRAVGAVAVVQRAKKKDDWKNARTKAELKAYKQSVDPAVADLADTLHHIVPKSDLKHLAGLLTPAQQQSVVQQVAPVAPTAGFPDVASVTAERLQSALANVPANFVIGPRPEQRNDDPGSSGPDLNRRNGITTPRSAELQRVYDFISTHRGAAPGTIPDDELQQQFITPLVEACMRHGPDVGLDHQRAGWSRGIDGKYQRV